MGKLTIDYNSEIGKIIKKNNSFVLGKHIKTDKQFFEWLHRDVENSLEEYEPYKQKYKRLEKAIHRNWEEQKRDIEIYSHLPYQTVNKIEETMFAQDPHILVNNKGNTPKEHANIKQAVLEKVWKLSKTRLVLKRVLRNTITGLGVCEPIYSTDHYTINTYLKLKEKQALLSEMENSYINSGLPIPPELDKEILKFEQEVKDAKYDFDHQVMWADSTQISGQPSLKFRDHHQFIPDMGAKHWEDMRYAGHWFWMPTHQAVIQFPKLKKANLGNSEKYSLAITDFSHDDQEAAYSTFASDNTVFKDMVLIRCIRYYKQDELKNKRVAEIFYAPYVMPEEPLLHRYMDIPFDSLPYRNLSFTENNDRLLPIPALEPLMTYSNILEVFLTKIVKSSNTLYKKILVDATFLENKEFENKYNRPLDEIIPVKLQQDQSLRDMIYEPNTNAGQVLSIMTQIYEFTRQRAEEITAQTKNMQGSEMTNKTATEAMILNDWASLAVNVNIAKANQLDEQIAYDYNTIIDAKYDREDYVEITADNSVKQPIKYQVYELYGQFTIDILTGSDSKGFRAMQHQKAQMIYSLVRDSGWSTGERARNNLIQFLYALEIKDNVIENIVDPYKPILSGWDEFGLLIQGEPFEPQPQEKFQEHIEAHTLQVELINQMPLSEEQKQMLIQFLNQHLEKTLELWDEMDKDSKNRYDKSRLDDQYPGAMMRGANVNMITNQDMPSNANEILESGQAKTMRNRVGV
jgi:hypothetical protein